MCTPITIGSWSGFRGLGEKVKLIAEYCHIPYTFAGHANHEEWYKIKPTIKADRPTIPYLIDGEEVLTESEALVRYIIFKAGRQDLLGTNTRQIIEYAWFDGAYADIERALVQMCVTEDPKFEENFKTKVLNKIEAVDRRIAGRKWCVGDDLTFVDFKISELYELITAVKPETVANLPNLTALNKKFHSLPEIAAYKASDRAVKPHFPAALVHIKV